MHLGSVGQSGRTPDSQWDAMMGKGQVALTMHHIGLGQSNVGVKRRPSAGGPPESRAESRPGWPGLVDVDVDGDGNIDVDGEVVRPVLCHFSVF